MALVLVTKDEMSKVSAHDIQSLHWHMAIVFGVRLHMRSHAFRSLITGFVAVSSSLKSKM